MKQKPVRFRWELCYELEDGKHWALCDTDTDARFAGRGRHVSSADLVLVKTSPNKIDGQRFGTSGLPKLIVDLLNAHAAVMAATGRGAT